FADRGMAMRADHVITVSEAARQYMIDIDHIRRDDIEVVYLGLDLNRMAPDADLRAKTRREFGFLETDFVVGYVANLLPLKGHLELVKAFGRVSANIPNAT